MKDVFKGKKCSNKKELNDAQKTQMPCGIIPMNFKLRPAAFNDEDWIFEIKWDGFRMISYNENGQVKLRSRNNSSFDKRFDCIKQELQSMKLNAVLDGEVVALDENGCSDFDKLMCGEKDRLGLLRF